MKIPEEGARERKKRMISEAIKAQDSYQSAFRALQAQRAGLQMASWLDRLRESAMDRFAEVGLPAGIVVVDFASALAGEGSAELMREYLGRTVDYAENGFTALNTAFVASG